MNNICGISKRLLDVAIFEHTVPDLVSSAFFVENAFVGERILGVDNRVERLVFDLNEFCGIICESS